MAAHLLLATLLCSLALTKSDYVITIYPEFLKIGGNTHFNPDHWNGKNGLDTDANIPRIKEIGAVAARWIHRDFAGELFVKATEDPNKKGYPDPAYFKAHQLSITSKYLANVNGYGNPEMVMELRGRDWPHWMDTSIHSGRFPNNIDAAAEFVSLLLQTVDKGTNGKMPAFFEVLNEPGGQYKTTNWTTIITFHQAVAEKLKPKYPHMRIGGPTLSGASSAFDRTDFKIWKKMAQFLDMSLKHLDFFSFHSYTKLDVRGGTHLFHQDSEAKLFGLFDLIESYAHKTKGKSYNVIVSEYGLGGVSGIDVRNPSTFLDWAQIYQHNAQMFTYIERRDAMRKAVAFLVTHPVGDGASDIHHAILDDNHKERSVVQAFKFWKNFHDSLTHLRVDSQFHDAERKIVPLALVDTSTGSLTILLHNHDQKPTRVKLNFSKGWFHPGSGNSTCEYLNSQKKPVLETNKPVHVANSVVTVPAEASCYFQFHTTHSFTHAPNLTQKTYYSRDMVTPIKNVLDVKVSVPNLGNIVFAHLRIGVSLTDKSANPRPKSVQMNNHYLTSFYSLHTNNGPTDSTVWQMYEYNVPVNILQQHNNDIKLIFDQQGGYVSTVAVTIGRH